MPRDRDEDEALRAVALENARAILEARHRFDARLARSLAMLNATLEATADGILATDPLGAVTAVNTKYAAMWRIPAEVMGTRDHGKYLEVCARQFDDPEQFVARVHELYAARPADSFDTLTLSDGRIYERVSSRQVIEGQEVGRVWSFRDITRRRHAESAFAAERERLSTTLGSIADGVISTDAAGNVVFMNSVAERLTGWALADAAGRPLVEVFVIVNQYTREPVENPAIRALREDAVVGLANHTVLVARDGIERPIDDSAAPMRDESGACVGVVLVFRDVTEQKIAEETQARLAAIVEYSDDVIVSKTLDGVIRSWNRAAERVFGYSAAEAIGNPITIIIPTERLDEERMILSRLVRGERIDHFETVRRAKDGRLIDVSLTVSPLRDAEGHIIGASKIARDITRQRRAEDELRDEQRIVQMLSDIGTRLAAELDLRKVLQAITDEATSLSGAAFGAFFYNATDEHGGSYLLYTLSGAPREAFASFPAPRATAIFRPTFEGRGVVRIDDVTRDPRYGQSPPYHGMPPGHLPVKSYLAVPVHTRSGEVIGGLFFGHPEPGMFSARHERMVVGIAAHAQVAIDNARLYEQLKEADRRKDEFLATLAHELRNPLAPVRTGLEILRLDPDPATLATARGMMERQVGHMVRLIDDLLDLSRITRNKVELRKERVDLHAIVDNAIEASRPLIDEAGHQLVVELSSAPMELEADPIRVAQVLSNLLNNAAKYTSRGGRIELVARREDGAAVVEVRDNGEGIPPDMLDTVFEMFTQVNQVLARSQGGLGIGLTLVRRLVEMHGGTVVAQSAGLGHGSTFIVRLPLAADPVAVASEETVAIDGEATAKLRVLVVDDNEDAAQFLAIYLRMVGHEVACALDGAQALAVAAELAPDAVVLDIGLPDMNGYEVARRLRASPRPPRLLVALTGWGAAEDRQLARAAGFDHHLTKPADPTRVQALLATLEP